MGDKNIHTRAKKFTKENQPSKESRAIAGANRKQTLAKKRELSEILSLVLKGNIDKDINESLMEEMGVKATTLEEALHFVQIAKALSQKDTQAYMALMNVSGVGKPSKVEHSGQIATRKLMNIDPLQYDTTDNGTP